MLDVKPCPDGRKCKWCMRRDDEDDPVMKRVFNVQVYMYWARLMDAQGQSVSKSCGYCYKWYTSVVRRSLDMDEKSYEQALAVENRIATHSLIIDTSIDQFVAYGGNFKKYLRWNDIEQTVRIEEFKTRQKRIKAPELSFLPTLEYNARFPPGLDSNGLRESGHHEYFLEETQTWGVAWREDNVTKII